MAEHQHDLSPESDLAEWQQANLAGILERLKPLRAAPDGIIHQEVTAFHDLIIEKFDGRINLIFDTDNPERFSIESRIDIDNPLNLLATYTQIMILSLIWTPKPGRVYMVGLGGGRIPMVLHHYIRDVIIECTEIDPILPEIAARYFGVVYDDRIRVYIQDGRHFLEDHQSDDRYDIILVDAFFGALFSPYQFTTQGFFELCKNQMSPEGVVMVNLISSDPLFKAKIETIRACFSAVYLCSYNDGDTVVVGSNAAPLSQKQIVARARALQARHKFSFPLVKLAHKMEPNEQTGDGKATILQDDSPPDQLFKGLSLNHPLFRNLDGDDPCPCNSGAKFKYCHLPTLQN